MEKNRKRTYPSNADKRRRFRYLEGLKQLVDTKYDEDAMTEAEMKEYEELKAELEQIKIT